MAQQKGIIKLDGTIGGITFYKSKDGYLAREKGGVSAKELQMIQTFNELARMVQNLVELVKPVKF
jgi:hypothetical protein